MDDLRTASLNDVVRVLDGSDRDQCVAAAAELSRRAQAGDMRGVQALVGALENASSLTPEAIAQAAADWEYVVADLERIGPPVVDSLLAALLDRDRSGSVRTGVARALGNIGDARAYEALVTVLQDASESLELRGMAAFYIGRLRDHRAVGPLLDMAVDASEDQMLRRNALLSLEELADPTSFDALVSLLHDPAVSNLASSALQTLKDPRALDQLLPTMASDDELWQSHVAAIVGKLGAVAVGPLIALTDSPDWRERSGAADALGYSQDRQAASPLTRLALQDPDPRVRRSAAASLGFVPGEPVIGPLLTALEDEDVHVRLAAMQSLYHLALTRRAPTSILTQVEWVATHDAGAIEGYEIMKDTAQRVARELRLAIAEEKNHVDSS